jgi:hypothetical protein
MAMMLARMTTFTPLWLARQRVALENEIGVPLVFLPRDAATPGRCDFGLTACARRYCERETSSARVPHSWSSVQRNKGRQQPVEVYDAIVEPPDE